VYYYRSLIALGQEDVVLKGIAANAPLELQVVKLLATLKSAKDKDNQDLAWETLKEWNEPLTGNRYALLIASQIAFETKHYKEALNYVNADTESLEMLAMTVQIYLKINRLDLAAKQVKAMAAIDDDDTLTSLATSWIYIVQGGEKVNEAYFLLQDSLDKFGPSPYVFNSMAVCQIQLKNYRQAFQHLKQARDQSMQNRERVSGETLINSIVCCQHLRNPESITRIFSELKQSDPSHPWLIKYAEMEAAFDKSALNYKL